MGQLDGNYRDTGLKVYGNKCELCGFGLVEVHHIDYHFHQEWEDKIRKAKDKAPLLQQAKALGFLLWDGKDLSKDNRSMNLSVLCPNHHTLVHQVDMGKSLLKILPARK